MPCIDVYCICPVELKQEEQGSVAILLHPSQFLSMSILHFNWKYSSLFFSKNNSLIKIYYRKRFYNTYCFIFSFSYIHEWHQRAKI